MKIRGFTLIEILVAVAILSIALAATSRSASLATDGALQTRQRLLATWAAQNRVAELRARRLFPSTGTTQVSAEQGGLPLTLQETVTATPNPTIRRVDLAVDIPLPAADILEDAILPNPARIVETVKRTLNS